MILEQIGRQRDKYYSPLRQVETEYLVVRPKETCTQQNPFPLWKHYLDCAKTFKTDQ